MSIWIWYHCNLVQFSSLSLIPDSPVIANSKHTRVVPANPTFANAQVEIAKNLMSDGKIKTVQDDVGFPFRIDTSDMAYVSSWTRPSNDIMVTNVDEMKDIEMSRNQILRAGYRSDISNGQPRLCLSYLIAGMFASAFSNDKTSPLIVDLIPGIDREKGSFNEDFCEGNGNVSIVPCMPLAKERMKYILDHYSKIFTEGKDVWDGFLGCIREERHIVKILDDADMNMLDAEYDSMRMRSGSTKMFRAILVQHQVTDKTIVLCNCWQVSSTIGGVSTIS